ncbi:lipase chaperone [Acinetobacter sp. ANC 3929]|uniref:lipase secretion chaperone n=1 Tax=unclassified Acinetobacter TaxID=196816 RepID=UPI0002CF5F58|nr:MULTISPECIES: lipase secretion chaperone [unclassified Acinetobacter]ENW79727.1 lipase chaperone [Acinetobacter sp. ANC 3929]MCH7352019.1 lipase secretion chaperone [Acinetobacter sp. NIPH 2023]MCH7354574.1 lipase secretion chaperone [Acinetobacter sp. NIPH 1958]MCH7359697.1 lipase secretion chaperone [Acinetobacter sp. NIPH 2024]
MNGKFLNNKTISLILIVCLLLLLALIYWIFKPDTQNTEHPLNQQTQSQIMGNTSETSQQNNQKGKMPVLAASLQGTEIDCPIQVDSNGKLILTVGIRSCFDYFFSSLGEKTETELVADIRQYLTATLPDSASRYAIYLLDQYVAYTHALKNIKPSGNFKTGDIDGFQKVIDQMYKVQQQFFNAAEINAFFGNERNLNQFNIDQMRIHANKSLTAQQKAAELAKLIDQLPSTLADGVRVSMQFAELQQLTQEVREKGGSSQELRNMRESLLGPEAADRLEKVDQEEAGWQTQVNGYLAARDQILKSDASIESKQQSINQLRNQSFGSKEDLLRAQSYEMIHDRK